MRQILLIILGLSISIYADFSRDNSTQIVTDNITMLQWQDDTNVSTDEKSWTEAISYCEALTLGSHNDWRLPNINELTSIVDDKNHRSVQVGNITYSSPIYVIFENVGFREITGNLSNTVSYYWTSSTTARDSTDAWLIDFMNGNSITYNKRSFYTYYHSFVRCVRAGQ